MFQAFANRIGEQNQPFAATTLFGIVPDSPRASDILFLSFIAGMAIIALTAFAIAVVRSQRRLRDRDFWLQTALSNMSHGLLLFDANERLVVCNERYIQLFGLSPAMVKPGCTLRELLNYRLAAGTLINDPDQYRADLLAALAQRKTIKNILEVKDGRTISTINQPLPGGGWVAVHEDITELRWAEKSLFHARNEAERAEREARAAHNRLRDAIEVVPEGIVLFDRNDRYVLWNRRYAEIYAESRDAIAQGRRFEETLRAGLDRGQYPDATGKEEEWLAARLDRFSRPASSHEERLSNGRWVRVEERRTADGGSIGTRVDITDLKERETSFRFLFEGSPVPMWVFDQDTLAFLAVNDATIAHYGYSREQFLSMTLLNIRPSEDHEALRRFVKAAQGMDRIGTNWKHTKVDGSIIDVITYARPLRYDGHNAALVAIIDVSERKRADDELRRTRSFLDAVIENVPTPIFVKDASDFRYILINRAAEKFYGISRAEMVGKTAADIFPQAMAETVTSFDRQLVKSNHELFLDEHPLCTPSNGTRLAKSKRIAIPGTDGQPRYVLGVIEDVTERKRDEARITRLTHNDALTDLPNRATFNECFETTIERAAAGDETFALMCVDLDRFKEINDVFGHSIGDALLRQIARRLQSKVEGAFLARLGGDEFAVIASDESQPESAALMAERILSIANEEFEVEGYHLRIGLSIGVAIYPTDGSSVTTLLGNADAALYRAKAEGRGMIRFFQADMDKRLRERRAMQHDLQSAIEREEIKLYYQPQARIGGDIEGFEALARWRHPTLGLVAPDIFIPIAEESGLIIQIGEMIIREACREAASWSKPLRIAINLSPVQFRQGDLPGLVHSILLETRLPANRLELEITEGVLIDDFSRTVSILRQLKLLGVRIAMDDFGTGYSSLSYLQSFPFDKIKIDRTFVANLGRNPQSIAIVRAVIGLGRGLNLPIMAEGVENEDQLAILTREGCDEFQGFLIGEPRPIEEYVQVIGRAGEKRGRRAAYA